MFHVPEKYRVKNGILRSDSFFGNAGAFEIPFDETTTAFCIASDGLGWEHVSVHIVDEGNQETPMWDEMCKIKDMFWDAEDCVIQYHPPKSEYVNIHEHVLHLWKPIGQEILLPPSMMVG